MLAYALLGAMTLDAPAVSVAPSDQLVQTIRIADLDGDGSNDTVELFCGRRGYCDGQFFDVIRFRLSASGTRIFRSNDGWSEFNPPGGNPPDVAVDPALFPQPNILNSVFAYAHRFPSAGTLVFLLGEPPGGSTVAAASIFRVTRTGVTKYFEPVEFLLGRFIRPTGTGKPWRMIAGTATGEVTGDDSFPGAQLETYCPETVFILGTKLSIDDSQTEKLARRRYGGYAGPLPRPDVMAVSGGNPPRRFLITWPGKKRIE